MAEASEVVPWTDLIEPWKKHRRSKGKRTGTRAEKAMRRIMTRLSKFLGHDDMGKVTARDITNYAENELLTGEPKYGKSLAAGGYREHVIGLQALFGLAVSTIRIATNPASHLTYERLTGERGRFTEGERWLIYDAALRSDNDLFRWANLFAMFHGTGIAEFCEAHTDDLVYIDGIPVLMIQITYRKGDEKDVKTKARKRGIPIHPAIRDAFVAWVKSLPPGPLFPNLRSYDGQRRKDASNKINTWLHDTVGIAKEKSFYWHRHTTKSFMEGAWVPDRLNDYIHGHSVHAVAAVYLHREVKNLLAAIETIPVPVPALQEAA
jgi:integrase